MLSSMSRPNPIPSREIGGRSILPIGLGTWAIGGVTEEVSASGDRGPFGWGTVDDRESMRAIHRALDLGAQLFDTANNYGAGRSERLLGRGLAGRRDQVVLVTKFGSAFDETQRAFYPDAPFRPDMASLRATCEASLRRLQTDHLDVYLFHRGDERPEVAVDVLGYLETLVEEGKIRGYGWSTDDPVRARLFAAGAHCVAVEFQLNLVNDAPEMLRVLDDHGLAGLIKQPLRSGLLTGRWTPETTFPADDGRAAITFAAGRGAWRLRQLNRLRPILTAHGRTFTQGALGWVLARHPRTIPIPGFKTAAQVEDLLGAAAAVPLEPPDIAAIEAALAAEGPAPD